MSEYHDSETGEIRPSIRMPPEIGKAIIQVTKQVKRLGKDHDNKFAGFKYVSVDKFYEEIGQLMAEAGLFTVIDEISITTERRETVNDHGQTKVAVWIIATYEIMLFHEDGAEYGPIHRTIMVQATGPQAFGSGMSYVEKYFLRALFKVPTGDEDADAASQEGLPAAGRVVPQTRGATRAAQPRPPTFVPAAAPVATSAAPSPIPSSTGNKAKPKWAVGALARESYEIDHNKTGGWSAWERHYLTVAAATESLEQFTKLRDDNKDEEAAFKAAVRKEVYDSFVDSRHAAFVSKAHLKEPPLVSEADAETILNG